MSKHSTESEEEREHSEDKAAKGLIEAINKVHKAVSRQGKVKKQHFKITVEPEDAMWISLLLYEECNRRLIEAEIHAKPGPRCIDMNIVITYLQTGATIAPLIYQVIQHFRKRVQKKQKRAKSKRVQKKPNPRSWGFGQ